MSISAEPRMSLNGKSRRDNRAKVGFSFLQLSVNCEKVRSKNGPINHQLMETHLMMITIIKDVTKSSNLRGQQEYCLIVN